jgi:hypothetical protein
VYEEVAPPPPMSSSARLSQFASPYTPEGAAPEWIVPEGARRGASYRIALGALIASLSVALPCAAQQGMGGSGGGGAGGSGTGGSGTGGSGTGGSGTGGSGTGGAGGGTGGSSMTGAGGGLDEPGAVCNAPEAQSECPERCPAFTSCVVTAMGQDPYLYYRVDDQRFDCDGLNCVAAAQQLGDYCCERGEFAPSKDGGGCALPPGGVTADAGGSESAAPWLGVAFGLCAAGVGRYRRRRARHGYRARQQ